MIKFKLWLTNFVCSILDNEYCKKSPTLKHEADWPEECQDDLGNWMEIYICQHCRTEM